MKIHLAFAGALSRALGTALAVICLWTGEVMAQDVNVAQYWSRQAPIARSAHARAVVGAPMQLSGAIPQMIASAAVRTGKAHMAAVLIRIAKIESGLRCSPGGNGGGLFQFIRSTRARLGLHNPRDCVANINAAMRYADGCIAQGARTAAHLMRCWNGGTPWARRLERAYRVALRA